MLQSLPCKDWEKAESMAIVLGAQSAALCPLRLVNGSLMPSVHVGRSGKPSSKKGRHNGRALGSIFDDGLVRTESTRPWFRSRPVSPYPRFSLRIPSLDACVRHRHAICAPVPPMLQWHGLVIAFAS